MSHDELRVDRNTKTLRELTLEKMRDAILDFRLRPGERLVERTLCERLGVSRTVVREVLRHLETEGLVESIPHQGPAVARPDPSKAAQIYEIRALLEAEAARACAARATPADVKRLGAAIDRIERAFAQHSAHDVLKMTTEFYEILFACAGKWVAWDIVQSLNARINHLRAMTISTPGRDKIAIQEMRRILDAIQRRDAAAAYQASLDHVHTVASLARQALTAEEVA
ncbi:MAG TPA: GntR family transcriptional regulator [Dongiaceae bacterium]|nr:GntR family transcriptional regulator [Dongiaceae bacterium]